MLVERNLWRGAAFACCLILPLCGQGAPVAADSFDGPAAEWQCLTDKGVEGITLQKAPDKDGKPDSSLKVMVANAEGKGKWSFIRKIFYDGLDAGDANELSLWAKIESPGKAWMTLSIEDEDGNSCGNNDWEGRFQLEGGQWTKLSKKLADLKGSPKVDFSRVKALTLNFSSNAVFCIDQIQFEGEGGAGKRPVPAKQTSGKKTEGNPTCVVLEDFEGKPEWKYSSHEGPDKGGSFSISQDAKAGKSAGCLAVEIPCGAKQWSLLKKDFSAPVDASAMETLSFWCKLEGAGDGWLTVTLTDFAGNSCGNNEWEARFKLKGGEWTRLPLPLKELKGCERLDWSRLKSVQFNSSGNATFLLDQIELRRNDPESQGRAWMESYPRKDGVEIKLSAISGSRSSCCLNGDWLFSPAKTEEARFLSPPEWRSVPVPSSWFGHYGEWSFPKEWVDCHFGWYYYPFKLSKEAQAALSGRRLVLKIGMAAMKATVFLNGKEAGGNVSTLPFEVNLTEGLLPDAQNELLVGVSDYHSLLRNRSEKESNYAPYTAVVGFGPVVPRGLVGNVELSLEPRLKIDDVYVATSVREGKISMEATLRNFSGEKMEATLESAIIDAAGKPVLSFPPQELALGANGAGTVKLDAKWLAERLWSPDDPYLYKLRSVLKRGGEPVDSVETKFGYRELWKEGSDFHFNGKKFHIRGNCLQVWFPFLMNNREYYRAYLENSKAANINTIRLYGGVFGNRHSFLDLADEMGMLVVEGSELYNNMIASSHYKPFWKVVEGYIEGWIRENRRHTSIVIWTVANEHLFCGASSEYVGMLCETAKRADPFRLVMSDADLDGGGKADIYSTHGMYSKSPNEEQTCGSHRYKWDGKLPLYMSEFSGPHEIDPDSATAFIGEDAYKDLLCPPKPDRSLEPAQAEYLRKNILRCRFDGVAGINPFVTNYIRDAICGVKLPKVWPETKSEYIKVDGFFLGIPQVDINFFDPSKPKLVNNAIFSALRDTFSPILMEIEPDCRGFFGGDLISKKAHVFNDTLSDAKWDCKWRLSAGEAKPSQGSLELAIPAGEKSSFDLRLETPKVGRRTKAALEVSLSEGGVEKGRRSFELELFPKPSGQLELPPGTALYDPADSMKGILAGAQPPDAQILKSLDCDLEKSGLLVVAPGGLDGELAKAKGRLLDFVRKGGKMLFLEGEDYNDVLPGVEQRPDAVNRSFLLDSPLCEKLKESLGTTRLAFLGPDGAVARNIVAKPSSGQFMIHAECAADRGLKYTPLMEFIHGDGRIMLCQLALVKNFLSDPAANILLREIVAYFKKEGTAKGKPCAILCKNGESAKSPFAKFKIDAKYVSEQELPSTIAAGSGVEILLIDAREKWNLDADGLRRFVESGGSVLLKGLTPASADTFASILPSSLKVKPRQMRHELLLKEGHDALLYGLSDYDLCWMTWRGEFPPVHTAVILNHGLEFKEGEAEALIREPRGTLDNPSKWNSNWPCWAKHTWKEIPNPLAALTKAPLGKGRVIIDQVCWENAAEPRATRYASALLSNLGLKANSSVLDASTKGAEFFFVDLKPFCNTGFKDATAGDGEGGWTDQGNNDLRGFQGGRRVFAGTPFNIAPQDSGNAKTCIGLGVKRRPDLGSGKTIRVDALARQLYFLHAGAWIPYTSDKTVGKYVVEYMEGGIKQEIPIRANYNIADWWQPFKDDLPSAKRVVSALSGDAVSAPMIGLDRSLYMLKWENPYPDKAIKEIAFKLEDDDCNLFLLGITGASEIFGGGRP